MLGPVDMSLQTLAVLLIGATFGFRLGVATLLLYLAQGAAGLPVFQSTPEKGIGLAYMIGPTGGYLVGFLAMAAIVGWAVDRGWGRNIVKIFGRDARRRDCHDGDGLFLAGMLIGAEKSWQFGVVPFIVPDLIKVALAAAVTVAATGMTGSRSSNSQVQS